MVLYGTVILGDPPPNYEIELRDTIMEKIEDFEFTDGKDFMICNHRNYHCLDSTHAVAVAYFVNKQNTHLEEAKKQKEMGRIVIPVYNGNSSRKLEIPNELQEILGINKRKSDSVQNLATALLECVGLLNHRRKIFISYVQKESYPVAIQLYRRLSALKFDVFLDMHKIRHGDSIPDRISHQLINSDIVIALNSENYKDREWTQLEYFLAKLRRISIVQLDWPGVLSGLSGIRVHNITLNNNHLRKNKSLKLSTEKEVVRIAEAVRSRSIMAQREKIVNNVKDKIDLIGGVFLGIGAHASIFVKFNKSNIVRVIHLRNGIPDCQMMQDVEEIHNFYEFTGNPILVYDEEQLTENSLNHVEWLGKNVTCVKNVKLSEFPTKVIRKRW